LLHGGQPNAGLESDFVADTDPIEILRTGNWIALPEETGEEVTDLASSIDRIEPDVVDGSTRAATLDRVNNE
jgi:hypothetical protein